MVMKGTFHVAVLDWGSIELRIQTTTLLVACQMDVHFFFLCGIRLTARQRYET